MVQKGRIVRNHVWPLSWAFFTQHGWHPGQVADRKTTFSSLGVHPLDHRKPRDLRAGYLGGWPVWSMLRGPTTSLRTATECALSQLVSDKAAKAIPWRNDRSPAGDAGIIGNLIGKK